MKNELKSTKSTKLKKVDINVLDFMRSIKRIKSFNFKKCKLKRVNINVIDFIHIIEIQKRK